MARNFRRVVIALSSLCLVACTTLQSIPITRDTPHEQRPALVANEEVKVALASGEQLALQVVASDAQVLTGITRPAGETRRVAWADIVRIDREKADATKTTLLAVAIVVILVVAIAGAASNAIAIATAP